MATAEFALALPALAVAVLAVIGVGQAVVAQICCVDGARAGARAAARGQDDAQVTQIARQAAGSGATDVTVRRGRTVLVEVRRRLRLPLPGGPHVEVHSQAQIVPEQIVPELGVGGLGGHP